MKKYVRWGLIALAMVVVIGGFFWMRQMRHKSYICSPLDSVVNQGNAPDGGGTTIDVSYNRQIVEKGTSASAEYISVRKSTSRLGLDRTGPIELEADRAYVITFELPEASEDFDLDAAVFRVNWDSSVLLYADEESSLTAVISDGHTTLSDTISFVSHEQALHFYDKTPFVMRDNESCTVGTLKPGAVLGLNGDDLHSSIDSSGTPRRIEYCFRTKEYDSQTDSSPVGASGDAIPIKPNTYDNWPGKADSLNPSYREPSGDSHPNPGESGGNSNPNPNPNPPYFCGPGEASK